MSSHLTFTSTHLASHTRHLHSRFVGRVSFFPLFSVWMLRNASWQIPLKLSASSLKWAFSCMVLSTTSYTVRYVYQKDKKKSYLLTCLNQFIKKMKSLYLRYQYTQFYNFSVPCGCYSNRLSKCNHTVYLHYLTSINWLKPF